MTTKTHTLLGVCAQLEGRQAVRSDKRDPGIGGVLAVAVLAAVFPGRGGYATPVAIGAAAALLIQPLRRTTAISLKPAMEAAS